MAGSVRLFGGVKAGMPTLADRSPGYCTDTYELYMGSPSGNRLIASASAAAGCFDSITLSAQAQTPGQNQLAAPGGRLMMGGKRLAFMAGNMPHLSEEADLSQTIAAFNGLLDILKEGGVMEVDE